MTQENKKAMIIAEELFTHELKTKKGFVCGQIFTHTSGQQFTDVFEAEKFAADIFKLKLSEIK